MKWMNVPSKCRSTGRCIPEEGTLLIIFSFNINDEVCDGICDHLNIITLIR
jgi:hypothetical protein